MSDGFFVPTYRVLWKEGGETIVSIDDATQRLWRGETRWEIAAAIACVRENKHHSRVLDVKEV